LKDKNSHLSLIQSTVTSKKDPDGRSRHHIQSESFETKSSIQRYSVHFCQSRSVFQHSCSLSFLSVSLGFEVLLARYAKFRIHAAPSKPALGLTKQHIQRHVGCGREHLHRLCSMGNQEIREESF
jgi:hypothetical protein